MRHKLNILHQKTEDVFLLFGKNACSTLSSSVEVQKFVSQQAEPCIFQCAASGCALFLLGGGVETIYFALLNNSEEAAANSVRVVLISKEKRE